MSKINKIKLSGTTYDVEDANASKTVELTQAQYDALVSSGAVDSNTFYIITDAQAGDLTNYYTKTETNTLLNGKQDTLVSGTNIKTINNESLLGSGNIDIQGGGGKAISGGTNISITTGETADTINCTVPASASSGNYSIMFGQPASSGDASGSKTITGGQWSKAFSEGAVSIGQMNEARGQWAWAIGNNIRTNGKAAFACGDYTSANANYAFSEGTNTTANTQASHSAGSYTNTKNRSEFSIGEYNNSVSASTTFGDSGNTLFSVGNGTSTSARHNAFEIRQNGDIYLTLNDQDVKLQDQLGGSSITVDTALDSGSTNAVANSAITNNTLSGGVETSNYLRSVRFFKNNGQVAFYKRFAAINGNSVMVDGTTESPNFQLVGTSAITTSITSGSTDSQVPSAKAVYDAIPTTTSAVTSGSTAVVESGAVYSQLGGLKLVKLTQTEYDNLGTKDSNTLYVITTS